MICLQCSGDSFVEGDLSRDVLCVSWGRINLVRVFFFKMVAGYIKRNEKLLAVIDVLCSDMVHFKSLPGGAYKSCLCCKTATITFALKSSVE